MRPAVGQVVLGIVYDGLGPVAAIPEALKLQEICTSKNNLCLFRMEATHSQTSKESANGREC